ncbi:MAG: tetratricopeptide repeat protein [Bacteroidaceae bacterium]|nr:tetratricopeptide repeat protein [Bacteroidaceae bacterium]
MKRYLILLFICMTCAGALKAQTLRDYVRRGNRLMLDTLGGSDFSEKAIVQYKKAMEIDSTFSITRYNLGNALIKQGKPQDAMAEYQAAARYEKDKKRLSDIYHNMGVLLQASKEYAHAVECYKESLRNDPSNDETRYNYVLAKWHLKNQQNENQNGEDNKEEKQEQQKQEENKKEEQKKQQKQQEQEQQQNQPEMSKENAERLLQAAMRNEKETQEKIQRQQQDTPRRRLQKQW